ncbi:MAG: phosphotransferase enzyme family protein [Flavobacteriaceae bacterium]
MEETHHLLHNVLKQFKVPEKTYRFDSITQGFINDTYLVFHQDTALFILQRINHNVFLNIDGVMANIGQALAHLQGTGYARIQLIKTGDGHQYLNTTEGFWRLMTYIPQSVAYNTTTDPKTAYEAGRIIGRFHCLLHNAKVNTFVDTIPRFHDIKLRKQQFEEALAAASPERKAECSNDIGDAMDMLDIFGRLHDQKLPVRVCHNDTKLNNILFSKEEKRALCLIDLDTLMKGYFYYDFGDAVRTIVNTAPEDERDHGAIGFNMMLFEHFVDGLASNEAFLHQGEIESLTLGTAFMPFIHGLRALTDYLNGDIYYKVSYPDQNLVRCRSLFHFTSKTLEKKERMEEIIGDKLR